MSTAIELADQVAEDDRAVAGRGREPKEGGQWSGPLTLIRFEESGLAEGCNQPIGKLWLYVLESHLCLNR